eukprot:GHVU01114119.1.p2 GENE.GHVU01114119.1~~GHVU01114119.1.p2  ORF type:complete len:120 (-),score=15.19 GHVU01114119.1:1156-1515(-)
MRTFARVRGRAGTEPTDSTDLTDPTTGDVNNAGDEGERARIGSTTRYYHYRRRSELLRVGSRQSGPLQSYQLLLHSKGGVEGGGASECVREKAKPDINLKGSQQLASVSVNEEEKNRER